MSSNKNRRLSKSTLIQLEKDYINGMRLIDIEKKYNIAYSTIHYHRRKSLVNGKDWSKLRTERLRIVKDKADEEDYYLTKVGEILDSLLIQLESELNNVTDLSEMNKIVNMIDRTFNVKLKSIAGILKGNKETLLAGSRLYAEILIGYLHRLRQEDDSLNIDEFIETLPDLYTDVKKRVDRL
jgi:hypothetical protein